MAPKSSNFSKEEELLLQDFGRDLSKKSAVIFYIHAVFVSAIPICKYIVLYFLVFPNVFTNTIIGYPEVDLHQNLIQYCSSLIPQVRDYI